MLINILLLLSVSVSAFASDKGIYGIDDRKDIFEAPIVYQNIARSVAAVMDMEINPDENGLVDLKLRSFKEDFSLCDEERFSNQPIGGFCTASLIGPDIILTAGHCLPSKDLSCKTKKFVFGYQMKENGDWPSKLPAEDIYSCSEIIAYENSDIKDFAIIKLDRQVTGRKPLEVNKTQNLRQGDFVFAIGTPMGLPLKIADGAKVRSVSEDFFMTDLDTYGGNSGSPVFNSKTFRIEGILTGGGQDLAVKNDCVVSYIQGQDEGTGEMVSSVSQFSKYLP